MSCIDASTPSAAIDVTVRDQRGRQIPLNRSGNQFYFTVDRGVTPFMAVTSASGQPTGYNLTVRRWGCQ